MIKHLAMIMDGNRRWAKEQGFGAIVHRKEGVESIRTASRFCLKNGISYLTLYMLSLENKKSRSLSMLNNIFKMTVDTCRLEKEDLIRQGIRIRFLGRRDLFPASVRTAIYEIEQSTGKCNELQINLMFYYGGQQEIVYAAQQLAERVKSGELEPDQINETMINNSLWTGDIPAPDLIVRTGAKGATRLSNFLLFQAAYSELQFKDYYWPELTENLLHDCLEEFNASTRNFGA